MLLYKIGENPLTLYLCKYSFYSDNENVFPLCLWHNFPVFLYRNIHELSTNSCFFSILLAIKSKGYKRQIYDDKNPTLSLFYSTMYSQIHPLNLKYSIHLYACKLPLKKRYLKAAKPLCMPTWIFPRQERRHVYFSVLLVVVHWNRSELFYRNNMAKGLLKMKLWRYIQTPSSRDDLLGWFGCLCPCIAKEMKKATEKPGESKPDVDKAKRVYRSPMFFYALIISFLV